MAIAGAGLGGLCLAQGLKRAGFDVTVYERDPALDTRRQGYRLHLDARAGLALQSCLPDELFQLFLATCSHASTRLTVMSERLRILHEMRSATDQDPYAAATLATSVNRQTFREVLATGLDQQIRFGQALVAYRAAGDEIALELGDGSEEAADILVGADGVNSAVRRQYLPDAQVIDTGARCVYGRTRLTERTWPLVPAPMREGFTAIVGGDVGLAAGLVQFRKPPQDAAAASGCHLSPADDYMMWAVSGQHSAFPATDQRMAEMTPAELHQLAEQAVKHWHTDLRALLACADVGETFLVRVRASTPTPAWTPSRVTLLGDAIHAMSPARGSGANTALQDAGVLCRELRRNPDPVRAIGEYESQMRAYGYAAVRASREAEAETGARRNRLLFWLYRRLARTA